MRRILPLVAFLFYSLQFLSQGIGQGCPEVIDQQNSVSQTGTQGTDQFQTFTAGSNGTLTGIDFATNACPSYTYILTIYSGAGTGGTVLYSGTFTNTGVCNNWQPSNLALASGPILSNNNIYTFRIQSSTNMSTIGSTAGVYSGGYYYSSVYGTPGGWDLNFRTRMQTQNSYPTNNITAAGSLTVCAGGSQTLSGNGGGFNYQWYNTSGLITGATAIDYTAPAGNSYAVVKTNTGNGCFSTSNTLVVTAAPIASTSASFSVCAGSSLALTSIASGAASWNTGATSLSIAVSPTVFTSYSVQAVAPSGCITQTVNDVNVDKLPVLDINGLTATVNLGNMQTNVSDWSTIYYPFTDPLPANARITGYEFDFIAVDRAWGGTGCGLGTQVSGEAAGGAILQPTSTHTNYFTATTGQTYTLGGINTVGISFCGWFGWQAFVTNAKLIIHYDLPTQSVCLGQTATLTATGASTYTWSPAISNGVAFSPTTTGVYTVSGTNAKGCLANKTVTMQVRPVPNLTVTGTSTTCVGGTVTQSVSGGNTYTWSTGNTSTTQTFSPSGVVNYTISSTNTISACSASSVYAVNGLARPSISVPNYTICNGNTATLVPTGALTYTFSSGNNTVSPASNSSYSISGTSTAGCTSTAVAVSSVIVNPLPGLTAGGISVICFGKSTTLTAGSADTYSWSTGATSSVVVLSPTSTAQYSVTGTNTTTSCKATAVLNVTVNPLPPVAASGGTMCSGKSFTFAPTGGVSYTYSSGSAAVSPASNTNYTITGSGANGCTNTAVATVTVVMLPLISAASQSMCAGQTITFTPFGGVSYTWAPAGPIVSPATSTTYTLIGSSSFGCTNTAVVAPAVTVYTLPVVSISGGAICAGASFTFGPTGAVSYVFLPAGPIVSPLSTIQYSVFGTSALGCTSTLAALATVTVNALPNISVNSGTICQGMTFTLAPSGAASYAFSNGNSVVNPMTTTSYSISGTSSAGCASPSLAISTVTVFNTPTITVNSGSICSGQVFTIVPGGAASYVISGGSATVNPIVTTSYSVTGTSSAGCGSSVTAISTVSVETTPTISAASGTICFGQSFTLQPVGAASYSIAGGNAVVSPTSTINYQIIGYSPKACSSAPVSPTVTVNSLPSVSALFSPSVICIGNSVKPVASGAQTYNWSGNITNGTPKDFTTSGTHTVEGTDANGCSNSATAAVIVNNLPIISVASNNSVSCEAETVTLTASGAVTYTWSTASVSVNSVQSPTVTSIYTVTGTDSNACANSALFTQSVVACEETFNAFATTSDVECEGKKNGSIAISATAGYSNKSFTYVWSNPALCKGSDCSSIDSLDEGIYSVKVIMTYTLNGFFTKKDSLVVGPLKIEDKNGPCSVTIFQGISANSDGQNDHLFVENLQLYPKNKVTIFNRWGNLVAEISGYDNVENIWPRADEKDKLQASTYFYIIDLGEGGKPIKGWIEIIKN